jgi:hypothetical protein
VGPLIQAQMGSPLLASVSFSPKNAHSGVFLIDFGIKLSGKRKRPFLPFFSIETELRRRIVDEFLKPM